MVKYTGTFEAEFGERAKIIIEKGQLYSEDPNIGIKTQLHWITGNNFWVKETDMDVIFDTNAKGVITGAHYFNGFKNIILKRVEEIY